MNIMPLYKLDMIDLNIINNLQKNARISNVELSEKVNISPSACLRRVRELENRGVIKGYASLIEASTLELGVNVMVNVKLERQVEKALESFEKAIQEWPEVMETYLMTGDSDYYLRIVVKDLPAYEKFLMEKLTRLPGVASIKSSFALKEIVHRTALPMDHLKNKIFKN